MMNLAFLEYNCLGISDPVISNPEKKFSIGPFGNLLERFVAWLKDALSSFTTLFWEKAPKQTAMPEPSLAAREITNLTEERVQTPAPLVLSFEISKEQAFWSCRSILGDIQNIRAMSRLLRKESWTIQNHDEYLIRFKRLPFSVQEELLRVEPKWNSITNEEKKQRIIDFLTHVLDKYEAEYQKLSLGEKFEDFSYLPEGSTELSIIRKASMRAMIKRFPDIPAPVLETFSLFKLRFKGTSRQCLKTFGLILQGRGVPIDPFSLMPASDKVKQKLQEENGWKALIKELRGPKIVNPHRAMADLLSYCVENIDNQYSVTFTFVKNRSAFLSKLQMLAEYLPWKDQQALTKIQETIRHLPEAEQMAELYRMLSNACWLREIYPQESLKFALQLSDKQSIFSA